MDKPGDSPIASRTRSRQVTPHDPSLEESAVEKDTTAHEDLSKLNVDNEEIALPVPGKNEEFERSLQTNLQLKRLQEHFTMELALKQKIIEDQQQVLVQLQSSIQELMNNKNEPRFELPTQTITYNTSQSGSHGSVIAPSSNQHGMENPKPKYDNFIEQQLLKEKINNIRQFSGDKHADVNDWLHNIEHDFPSTLISEDIKLKLIPKSLTNDARNWFEQNKHRLSTWEIFKMEIELRFQSSLYKDQIFARLRERKQQLKETGQQFIDAMEKLCFQVNPSMTQQEKILHIKAGLKPSLKRKILDKQPQLMQELRDIIKRTEDIELMLNNGDVDKDQSEQTYSSNQHTSSLTLDPTESLQYDNNCFALPSNQSEPFQYDGECYAAPPYYNNPYRRQNRNYYQYQETNERGSNRNYQTRRRNDQTWNQNQFNYQRPSTSSSRYPPTTNNYQKKY